MFKYRVDTLISREDIAIRVKELANEINKDFEGEEVLFVGLLRGSVVFLADLVREIEVEATMDFMTVSSYGNSTESSRDVSSRFPTGPSWISGNTSIWKTST